jgi:hypothetical protein
VNGFLPGGEVREPHLLTCLGMEPVATRGANWKTSDSLEGGYLPKKSTSAALNPDGSCRKAKWLASGRITSRATIFRSVGPGRPS